MRYAIICDIHGNLEAFEAAAEAISREKVDRYLCLGDVVGYGADPSRCIALLKSLNPEAVVAGNHEWGVLGLLELEYFNDLAKDAIVWTRGTLYEDGFEYIRSFGLIHETGNFALVHGSLNSPEEFNYILNERDARGNMALMKTQVTFIGHTHRAGIFYSNGAVVYTRGPKIKIEPSKRYIVNAGSIGQPRDLDPRASYAVYDETAGDIEIKRVWYDVKAAQEKIIKAGLPKELALRLSEGR